MKACARCRRALPWNGGTIISEKEYCGRCTSLTREAARATRVSLEGKGQQSIGGLVELPAEEREQGSLFG